jgi:hypothetical protein
LLVMFWGESRHRFDGGRFRAPILSAVGNEVPDDTTSAAARTRLESRSISRVISFILGIC